MSNDAALTSGFSGCISDLKISTVSYDLSFVRNQLNNGQRGRGVTDCQDHPCNAISCQNGGTCANMNGLGSYSCVCPDDFMDEFCQTQIVNPCRDNNGGCNSNSSCVFDSGIQTLSCRCPFTPDPLTGDFCDQSILFFRYLL